MNFDEERLTGIGGSDAAAVLGISPWMTPYDLWCQKTGSNAPLATDNDGMHWGKLLEPVIRDEYTRVTGRIVKTLPMLRHPTHSFMIGHVDGLADPGIIVEVKTSRTSHGWGEAGTDEIPLQYLVQAHHYLIVAGAPVCHVAVLIGGSDFRIYEVRGDDDITHELVREEHEFWWRVEHREPPGPINLRDALRRWGWMTAVGTVVAGEAELFAVDRLHQIRQARKQLDDEAEEAQLVIEQKLGERGDCLVDETGVLLATWKLDKGRKEYTRTIAARGPQRRFLLKGEK